MIGSKNHEWTDVPFVDQTAEALFWLGDHIPGGFFVYRENESLELIYANKAALRIYGCATIEEFREFTGNSFRGMVHPEDFDKIQESIEDQIADYNNENFDYVTYRIIRKDGEVRWVEDYGHLVNVPVYGDVYYVFITDATERFRAERERLRTELAFAREMHAKEARSTLLFNLSHDIRTPMNAIVGFSELAHRHIGEPELLEDYLDKTVVASRQLLSLIDDMLEMNLLDVGGLELKEERTLMREVLEHAVDLVRVEAQEKGLTLQENYDLDDCEVLTDQVSLCRVVCNIAGNAVKFTPAGGTVSISARQEPDTEDGKVPFVITIADTGIGMSPEFMEQMYEPFSREGSATETRATGTGLGLSIVKSLLILMDGSIEAQSVKGEGTTFTVRLTLPLASAHEAAVADVSGTDADLTFSHQPRILVVEDVELNRMLIETVLEDEGFAVDSAADGYEAVQKVKRHPVWYYDLILMDIQMPVMNGYEASRAIRALPREDALHLPIIALSANSRDEDVRMSMESGMDFHAPKPFDADNLIDTIKAHVTRHRAGRSLL